MHSWCCSGAQNFLINYGNNTLVSNIKLVIKDFFYIIDYGFSIPEEILIGGNQQILSSSKYDTDFEKMRIL